MANLLDPSPSATLLGYAVRATVLVLVVFLATPAPAGGSAFEPVGDEVRVDEPTGCVEVEPALATLPSGEAVAIYTQPGDRRLAVRPLAADGSPAGDERLLGPATILPDRLEVSPDVVAQGDGFVAVWVEASISSPRSRILGRRLDATGGARGAIFVVDEEVEGLRPSVAVGPDGRFVVVWEAVPDVWGRLFGPDGSRLGERRLLSHVGTTTLEATRLDGGSAPRAAWLASGDRVAVALSIYHSKLGSSPDRVKTQIAVVEAEPSLPVRGRFDQVVRDGTRFFPRVDIAALPDGGFAVAAVDGLGLGPESRLALRLFDGLARARGPELVLETPAPARERPALLAIEERDEMVVAWSGSSGGGEAGVWGARVEVHDPAAPRPLGPAQRLSTGRGHSPVLARLVGSDLVIAWRSVPWGPLDPVPPVIPCEEGTVLARAFGLGRIGDATVVPLVGDGRFEVSVAWSDPFDPGSELDRTALGFPLTSETGAFWFFEPGNVEVVAKIIDGREVNGRWWVFFGSTSDVGFEVRVTDTLTGEERRYANPPGRLASFADTDAFIGALPAEPLGASGAALRAEPTPWGAGKVPASHPETEACAGAGSLCLLPGDRFALRVSFEDPRTGGAGIGRAVELTPESGYFWFFEPDNVEMFAKVIDGREVNGAFWVFYGSLTDVAFELEVVDRATGFRRVFEKPGFELASDADTTFFVEARAAVPGMPAGSAD